MASKIIFTSFCRASYVHLAQPYSQQQGQDPKYQLQLMFPKTGVLPTHISQSGAEASVNPIMLALDEVCNEHFGMPFAQAVPSYAISYPPQFKDGDTDWQKNDAGMVLQGQPKEASVGMWLLSVKSDVPVGTVDASGTTNIDPSSVYSGCWVDCQVEVSAYTNKSNANVIAIKLLNVQKCYDDKSLGGGAPRQAATLAFAGRNVADSNVVQNAAPAAPAQPAPVAPQAAPAPVAPVAPQAAPAQPAPVAPQAAPAQPAPVAPVAPQAAPAPVAPVAPQVAPAPVAPVAPQASQMPGGQYIARQ